MRIPGMPLISAATWETDGDTKTMDAHHPPERHLSVRYVQERLRHPLPSADKYVDGNGDRLDDVTCTTYISDVVTCDGVTLTPDE